MINSLQWVAIRNLASKQREPHRSRISLNLKEKEFQIYVLRPSYTENERVSKINTKKKIRKDKNVIKILLVENNTS